MAVEPVERFLNGKIAGDSVPSLEQDVTFILGSGREQTKQRQLQLFDRINEVILAVDHECWNANPGSKMEGIGLRRTFPGAERRSATRRLDSARGETDLRSLCARKSWKLYNQSGADGVRQFLIFG
jgi:hypothetical protein